MAESTDQPSVLEREIEKHNLPYGYDPTSTYTRLQQFKTHIAYRMVRKYDVERLDSREPLIFDFPSPGEDGHLHVLRFHVTDPIEIEKYVQSARYIQEIQVQTETFEKSKEELGPQLNRRSLEALFSYLIDSLLRRPKVFKQVYEEGISALVKLAQPLAEELSRSGPELQPYFVTSGGQREELSPSQQRFGSVYLAALRHFEQLE